MMNDTQKHKLGMAYSDLETIEDNMNAFIMNGIELPEEALEALLDALAEARNVIDFWRNKK